MDAFFLQARQLSKWYEQGQQRQFVLRGVDLDIQAGQSVVITGTSGVGKSTLLHLLSGLDRPSSGEIRIEGQVLAQMSQRQCRRLHQEVCGFLYQSHHLMLDLTVLENVALPLRIRGVAVAKAHRCAQAILERLGMEHKCHAFPRSLSGGESQRVAIARAVVARPRCIFADEPTGSLDAGNAQVVLSLLLELQREEGAALVFVTHDVQWISHFSVHYELTGEGLVLRS